MYPQISRSRCEKTLHVQFLQARSCSSSGSDRNKKKLSEVRGGKAKKFKSETSHSTSSPKVTNNDRIVD